jgi:manganese/iron transport system permease protein/iron/zinc/copper transport system permease protein
MPDLLEPLTYGFFQRGLIVAVLSGALLGFIGVYIVLRGMSYIGHGLSHAIFGGFAAMQLFAAQFYLLGAGLWGVISALAITTVSRRSRVGADAAIGVITTASFALGVALFAKFGSSGPSFDNALFGSILGISPTQIWGLLAVTVLTGVVVFLRYRVLLFTTFDPEVAAASGIRVPRVEALLMIILSLAILATLTVIGVTLVAAMLVIPAVVARMITDSFGRMLAWSTVVGLACGLVGMYLSYYAGVPSGTMIVLVGAAVFVIVLAITGGRGLRRAAGVDAHAA